MPLDPNPAPLTTEQLNIIAKLRRSNNFYARTCLKIKTDKGLEPFVFNEMQDYLDWHAERQLAEFGKVRIVLVKARQQGGSEYIACRGFKFATQNAAKTVYILSHESSSTQTLFAKVDRYARYAPKFVLPEETTSNRNQKKFGNESEYTVGTAGSENTGRSNTVQFAHISEPAHYENDEGIKSGLLQTISDERGTEIWFESTANGRNWFYHFCMRVLAGETEYLLLFAPWFWSAKYSLAAPSDFKRTPEEDRLSAVATCWNTQTKQIELRPLTDAQLFWRRRKIAILGEKLFKQEYPATLDEAFQSSGDSFIDGDLVEQARKSLTPPSPEAPLILGVDPGRTGDRTVLTERQGRRITKITVHKKMDSMLLAGIIANRLDQGDVDRCFIDYGMGHGTIDRLRERGYQDLIEGVNFGGSPFDDLYANKRAEMTYAFDAWLKDTPCALPDDNDVAADIASMPQPEFTSTGKIKFPPKDEIKANYGRSPDIFDSIILTFAAPVRGHSSIAQSSLGTRTANTKPGSGLTTLARMRQDTDDLKIKKTASQTQERLKTYRRSIT